MKSKSPLRTQDQYIDCLNTIYQLLQKNLRVNGKSYIKLIICCALVNQYQAYEGTPVEAIDIYNKIDLILQNPKKQKMLTRIGVVFKKKKTSVFLLELDTFGFEHEVLPGFDEMLWVKDLFSVCLN